MSNPFASMAQRLNEDTRTIDLTKETLPGVDRAAMAEEFRARAESCCRVGKFACASDYLRLYFATAPKAEES